MAAKEDYYAILGVERDASEGDIKRAYKQMAKKYHPDLNPGDQAAEDRFKQVNEAYSVVGDAGRRQQYDQFGHAAFEQGGGGGFDFENFGFGSIFEDIFGGIFDSPRGGGRRRQRRGEDMAVELTIDFMEAVHGCSKEVAVERIDRCPLCGGSGEKENASRVRCPECEGQGKIHFRQGFFTIAKACPRCHGEGIIIQNPCDDCKGHGLVAKVKKLTVTIPKGVYTGARLRLEGEGNAGPRGAERGDLHVVIQVRNHELFQRKDDHILFELPVSFPQAALGTDLKVPTVHGEETVTIKPGTQSGDVIQLKNRGVDNIRGHGRGDQVIQIHVETPTNLSARQEELLREFAEVSGDHVQPMRESFFKKVKDFLGGI